MIIMLSHSQGKYYTLKADMVEHITDDCAYYVQPSKQGVYLSSHFRALIKGQMAGDDHSLTSITAL